MSKKLKTFHVGYDLRTYHWEHIDAKTEEEAEQKIIAQVSDENRIPESNIDVHSVNEI